MSQNGFDKMIDQFNERFQKKFWNAPNKTAQFEGMNYEEFIAYNGKMNRIADMVNKMSIHSMEMTYFHWVTLLDRWETVFGLDRKR